MTKLVRIENADTSDYRVVVEVWEKSFNGEEPDVLVDTVELNYPTAMTREGTYLTETRYLIVRELPAKE